MSDELYILEVSASNGTSILKYHFSTGIGFTSTPTDTPPNTFAEPRIIQPGLFRQSMFDLGTTSGHSSGGYGEIILSNVDGSLDYMMDLGFDGQACVVKKGYPGWALSKFVTAMTGTIEQPEISWENLKFRWRDTTAEFNVPAQPNLYGGTNVLPAGIDGTTDIKGKNKPLLFGECFNITPECVNTSKLIYQINDGVVFSIPRVADMGVSLEPGVDRADNAALQANAPPVGGYDTCLAEGLFRLGSMPVGQITCDGIQGATSASRTTASIIRSISTGKLGANRVVSQSLIDLDKTAPYIVGIYVKGTTTVSSVLDQLCTSIGAWWGFDNLGNFWCRQLTAPVAAQSIITLTEIEIKSISRVATADSDRGVPIWRVNMDYSKNWTLQQTLAGSVIAGRYNLGYKRTTVDDSTVKAVHSLSPEITIQSTIVNEADAITEGTRSLNLRKVRRDRLKIDLDNEAIRYADGGYWDDEAISEMPYSLYNMGFTTDGTTMYVAGGVLPGSGLAPYVHSFDLSNPTTSYTALPNLPQGMNNPHLFVYNGFLYALGALNIMPLYRLDLSNPVAWSTTGLCVLPNNRQYSAVYEHNGYLYVFGGYTSLPKSCIYHNLSVYPHNDAGASWEWENTLDMPITTTRFAHAKFGGIVYIIAGTEVISYSIAGNNWTRNALPAPPASLISAVACICGDYLFLMGGMDTDYVVQQKCWKINLMNPTAWIPITDLPGARTNASVGSYEESLYLLGGLTTVSQSNTWRLRTNDNPEDLSQLVSLGRTVLVKHPRYGYTSGRPMKIIGIQTNNDRNTVDLYVWG